MSGPGDLALATSVALTAVACNPNQHWDADGPGAGDLVERSSLGIPTFRLVAADGFAWACDPGWLSRVDLSDPDAATLLAGPDPMDGVGRCAAAEGVAWGAGAGAGLLELGGASYPIGNVVAVGGDASMTVVLADGEVRAIHASDPTNPIGRVTFPTGTGDCHRIVMDGTTAWVMCEKVDVAVELASPATPTVAGTLDHGWLSWTGIAFAGGLAYVSRYDHVDILDLADPTAPALVGTLDDFQRTSTTDVSGIAIDGDDLWVADERWGVWHFDRSTPTAPELTARLDVGPGIDVVATGGVVWLARTDGVSVITRGR